MKVRSKLVLWTAPRSERPRGDDASVTAEFQEFCPAVPIPQALEAEDQRRLFREKVASDCNKEMKDMKGPTFPARSQEGVSVFFANCKSDHACKYRYRAEFCSASNTMKIFGKGRHGAEPAVCRSDARIPLTRPQQRAAQAEIARVGAERARPADVHDSVGDTDAGYAAGSSIKNMVKKARRRGQGSGRCSVEGLERWSDGRVLRLETSPLQWPDGRSPHEITVLSIGEGDTRRIPVISKSAVLIAFTAKRFVDHIFDVAGQSAVHGFVGQCDFLAKIVFQGYKLGVIGVQLFREILGDWIQYFFRWFVWLLLKKITEPMAWVLKQVSCSCRESRRAGAWRFRRRSSCTCTLTSTWPREWQCGKC